MLSKNLLLLSVACFSFHENFGAELKWQCFSQEPFSEKLNETLVFFVYGKAVAYASNGHRAAAYNDNSSVHVEFEDRGARTISKFKISDSKLYILQPLRRDGDKINLLARANNQVLYKYTFGLVILAQAPVEAKE